MSAPSVVGIWNRALQLLGASRVQSVDDTGKNGLACRVCYEVVRDRILESHPWRFATKISAELAADSPAPAWGRANSFTLPSDFLCMCPKYPEDESLDIDYEVEDGKIYTDESAPLTIRYIYKVENPVKMPATFRELLSHEMAMAMCEEVTQSNTKKTFLQGEIGRVGGIARRANSRLTRGQTPPDDPWLKARR